MRKTGIIILGLSLVGLALFLYWKIYIRDQKISILEKANIPVQTLDLKLKNLEVEGYVDSWLWIGQNLSNLTIRNNKLTEIPRLPEELKRLTLSRTSIVKLGGLASLPGLDHLILEDNPDLTNGEGIESLKGLKTLVIRGSRALHGVSLGTLPELESLEFDDSNGELLVNLDQGTKLKTLKIRRLSLDSLPSLLNLKNLKSLSIEGTLLTQLPELPESLEELHLVNNQLLILGDELAGLDGLRYLEVQRNRTSPTRLPLKLEKLITLLVLPESLEQQNLEALRNLDSLTLIQAGADVASNLEAWKSILPQLISLKLYWFNDDVDLKFLTSLPKLTSLTLEKCIGIKDFSPLSDLSNLMELEISGTRIKSLQPPGSLKSLILDTNEKLGKIDGVPQSLIKLKITNNGSYLPIFQTLPPLDELILASTERDSSDIGLAMGQVTNWTAIYRQLKQEFDPSQVSEIRLFTPRLRPDAFEKLSGLEFIHIDMAVLPEGLDLKGLNDLKGLQLAGCKGPFPEKVSIGLEDLSFSTNKKSQ